jgi:circadian clock protein KaiB
MPKAVLYSFRLYVAGNTPNSAQARVNLGALCRKHLMGCYRIEIVDVYKEPDRALREGIFMTPALIKLSPSPVRMIVGTLAGTQALFEALGLPEAAA